MVCHKGITNLIINNKISLQLVIGCFLKKHILKNSIIYKSILTNTENKNILES